MRIDILTLFPNLIKPFTEESIIKIAIQNNKVEINMATCGLNFCKSPFKTIPL